MLIECKPYSAKERALSARDGQLARYFAATSAKIAVITNGIMYRFFTDLDKNNIQDVEPFFVFDCVNPTKADLAALERFVPANFDVRAIKAWASDHQFAAKVRAFLINVVSKPQEVPGFALYLLEHTYGGARSQKVVQRLNEQLPDLMNEVLGEEIRLRFASNASTPSSPSDDGGIITTEEERAALSAIKGIVAGAGKAIADVAHRDMKNWMNVSFKTKGNWFLRLCYNDDVKGILFRASSADVARVLPDGYTAAAKGKNTYVVLDPQNIAQLARAILLSFDARTSAKETSGDEDEGDEAPLLAVA